MIRRLSRGRRTEKTFDLRGFPWNTSQPLWHGTTALRAILDEGFKTRRQAGGRHATGGGPDDAVSLTADRRIATAIVVGLDTGRRIALNPDGAYWLKRLYKGIPKPKREALWRKATDYWQRSWDGADLKLLAENHLVERAARSFGADLPPGATPIRVGSRGNYFSWSRPATAEERASLLWKLYTTILSLNERTFYNPAFWLTDPAWLASLGPEDLGVLLARSNTPFVCTEPWGAVTLGYMEKPSEYMTAWAQACRWQISGDFAKGRDARIPRSGLLRYGDYTVDYDSPIRRVSPQTSMIAVNAMAEVRVYDPSMIEIDAWWTLDKLRKLKLAPQGIYHPWFRAGVFA